MLLHQPRTVLRLNPDYLPRSEPYARGCVSREGLPPHAHRRDPEGAGTGCDEELTAGNS